MALPAAADGRDSIRTGVVRLSAAMLVEDMNRERATQIMLKVHQEGLGVCGVFAKDIAATKVDLVVSFARHHQHPLQCVMEET